VPEFALPDLSGTLINLADVRDRATLVLFWNPGCGFCQRMLEDLKAWEAKPPPSAPQLLIVSTGTVEANQAMGLRSLIVLDGSFMVGRTLGARGTPMAVLVNTQGHIASEVVAGAPAIMALANGQVPLTLVQTMPRLPSH
jgi:thiol-disulfide isomerase/thioredoxin